MACSEEFCRYLSKHLGQYKFQMDLANDLTSRGIKMDWSDMEDDETKPVHVRRQDCVPCGCNACFFCKRGLTHGVDHKKKGKRRSRSVARLECPTERDKIRESPRHCALCHKNQRALNPTSTAAEIKKPCNNARLGCPTCEVPVCAECWNAFEHSTQWS